MATKSSALRLQKEYQQIMKTPIDGFTHDGLVDDNIYEWDFTIIGPPDSLYEGGVFNGRLSFPDEFPLLPPKLRFTTPIWHPNIYPDGKLCISILHDPGEDVYGYEQSGERWLPVHSVESIIVSVISLLSADNPSPDGAANVTAATQIRNNFKAYKREVRRCVERSLEEPASVAEKPAGCPGGGVDQPASASLS